MILSLEQIRSVEFTNALFSLEGIASYHVVSMMVLQTLWYKSRTLARLDRLVPV